MSWRLIACRATWLILAVSAGAPRLAAQDKPDLSGRWVLESRPPPGSDVPRALSVRQRLVRTTVRGDPINPFFEDLTVTREGATRPEGQWNLGDSVFRERRCLLFTLIR